MRCQGSPEGGRRQQDSWFAERVDPLISRMVEAIVVERPEDPRSWMKSYLDEGRGTELGIGCTEQVSVASLKDGDHIRHTGVDGEVVGEKKVEADTEDSEDVFDLNDLLLPGGRGALPLDVERFSVSYSGPLLTGWVKQGSPCCAAASVAGAWNALTNRSRGDEGALNSESVMKAMRVVLEEQITSMTARFERLLGARFEPLFQAIKAELTLEERHLGGGGPRSAVAKGPHLLRLTRSITSRERDNPDHSRTFDRLWELYEVERELACQLVDEAAAAEVSAVDGATQENLFAVSVTRREDGGDGGSHAAESALALDIVSSVDRNERHQETSGCVDQGFVGKDERGTSELCRSESATRSGLLTSQRGQDGGDDKGVYKAEEEEEEEEDGGSGGQQKAAEEKEAADGSARRASDEGSVGEPGSCTCERRRRSDEGKRDRSSGGDISVDGRRREATRWRWKKDLADLLKQIGGLDKLRASSPSTAAFGNLRVISTIRHLDNDLADPGDAQVNISADLFMGKAPPARLPVPLSERDSDEEKAEQWAALRQAFLVDRQVLIFHQSNHYALIFALREWRSTDSPTARDDHAPTRNGGAAVEAANEICSEDAASVFSPDSTCGSPATAAADDSLEGIKSDDRRPAVRQAARHSPLLEGGWTRQILTARKGQRPTAWIDFEEARGIMLGWDGYKILVVRRGVQSPPPAAV